LRIDEGKLLRNFAKALGNEQLLDDIEKKRAREASLLESMNNALKKMNKNYAGIEEQEEVKKEPEVETVVIEEVAEIIAEATPIIEVVEEQQPELITEIGRQPEPELPKDDIVNKYVVALSKPNQQDGDIQAVADKLPPGIQKELDIIRKSIADFHRFAQRHSQLGGGGAGDVVNLDHPAKTVTSNYTFTNKDYYIGAGVTPINITLPVIAKNGRVIVIKDEVGNCSTNPITVYGNETGGSQTIPVTVNYVQ